MCGVYIAPTDREDEHCCITKPLRTLVACMGGCCAWFSCYWWWLHFCQQFKDPSEDDNDDSLAVPWTQRNIFRMWSVIVAEIMEDGAEPCATAATFISEILPMMGAVTEQSSSRYQMGLEAR